MEPEETWVDGERERKCARGRREGQRDIPIEMGPMDTHKKKTEWNSRPWIAANTK